MLHVSFTWAPMKRIHMKYVYYITIWVVCVVELGSNFMSAEITIFTFSLSPCICYFVLINDQPNASFSSIHIKRPSNYDVLIERGDGVLKSVSCLWILFFLNNISVVHFCGMGIGCVTKLVSFCGSHKWVTLIYCLWKVCLKKLYH